MNRQGVIDLIVARGVATPQQLQSKTVQELERILDESLIAGIRAEAAKAPAIVESQRKINEIQADRIWSRFFFKHPEITDVAANRKMIFDYAFSLSDDGVVTFEHLDEAAKTLPGLDRQKVKQPPTAANLKHDEVTLQEFCRANQLVPNTAALNLLRQEFGAGFDSAQIDRAVQAGVIILGPASEEQLQRWSREDQEERQDYLVNQASPPELRQAARQESEQRRIQAQQQHAAQQVQIREQAEASVGYTVLPETDRDGSKIDRAYLLKLADMDIRRYKQLCNFHGMANVTARLNGVR